ncbi:MAG: sensor histidine kinase [Suilimivivens sp.]
MSKWIKKKMETFLWGPKEKPYSLRKQLSRVITYCCIVAVTIQAIVMVSMIISQYVRQEREDTLYILESDNSKMETKFQYLKEIALAIQHDLGLKTFFWGQKYNEKTVTAQLENTASLFAERNLLETSEPFIEKIYLFNGEKDVICHLYYPVTVAEYDAYKKKYQLLYDKFLESKTNFYYYIEDDFVNLCMYLYDTDMKNMGGCVFVLNKSAIENNYSNLEKMTYYSWSIMQGDKKILGKENISIEKHPYILENTIHTGFGLSFHVAVSEWVILQSLGNTVLILVFISSIVIILLSILARILVLYYMQPLETVAEKIKLVGKGNFDTKLDEYRVEELQNISNTFNEMTDYINRLIKEVYETQLIAQQAQIQYLQAQMNPHFLFNVLSMIEMRAALNGDDEVREMLYKLSRLYQGKIFRKNEHFISLLEEMEIVDFYLSIQNSRFGDKITYNIHYVGDEELYKTLLVPKLSIEPIVENAVCHGLEPKKENGHISIIVLVLEDKLVVLIRDNGVGFDSKTVIEKKEDKNHTHVGLWNTNKMIHNLCGNQYGLEIQSKVGEGTTVQVVLPIKSGEEYVEGNDC